MKKPMTLTEAMADPRCQAVYRNVKMAFAQELSDAVSLEYIRAQQEFFAVDADNEPAYYAAFDRATNADHAFTKAHSETVVTL